MGEWSLIYDASEEFRALKQKLKDLGMEEISRPFLSGGFWRNFFSKYPESNLMHKKMLHVSEKIHHLPDGETKGQALNELWKGQCNDAYWHGVFGGLYLPHLRSSVYEHLIKAEAITDQALHQGEESWVQVLSLDLDKDGNSEEILNTEHYTLVSDPMKGGTIMELDFKPRSFNLQDTFTRVPEFYHKEIVNAPSPHHVEGEAKSIHDRVVAKEEGLAEQIVYDLYPKRSLVDHFLDLDDSLESFRMCKHRERGDFVQGAYQAEHSVSSGHAEIIMERTGWVNNGMEGASAQEVRVRKTIQGRAGDASIMVIYKIENLSDQVLAKRFGVELNMTLLAGNAPDRYYILNGERPSSSFLCSVDESPEVHSVHLVDEWKGIEIKVTLDRPGLLWRFPIETVSLSESGFEKIYQGSSVVPLWDIQLAPHTGLELNIGIELCSIPDHHESKILSQEAQKITE
jgi:alpha-amylase